MEKEEIVKIIKDLKEKPNSKIIGARDTLTKEYDKTKQLIVDLTHHLDAIELMYNKLNNELKNRNL